MAACALKAMGGDLQCKLYFRDEAERRNAEALGVDADAVLAIDDLVKGDDCFFAGTGITSGELLRGVRYIENGAITESVVMRARSGTTRYIRAVHGRDKLSRIIGE